MFIAATLDLLSEIYITDGDWDGVTLASQNRRTLAWDIRDGSVKPFETKSISSSICYLAVVVWSAAHFCLFTLCLWWERDRCAHGRVNGSRTLAYKLLAAARAQAVNGIWWAVRAYLFCRQIRPAYTYMTFHFERCVCVCLFVCRIKITQNPSSCFFVLFLLYF